MKSASQILQFDPAAFDRAIEMAEDAPEIALEAATKPARHIHPKTMIPSRYRREWERPQDAEWQGYFGQVLKAAKAGGIIGLIGIRGGGKTRLAAEVARSLSRDHADYTTAMELFLRLRESYGKKSKESEREIVREYATSKLLIIDELQERGGSEWEDRILTHIIDRRYGAELPTIIIANLTEDALIDCLGDSIASRLHETGGILEISKTSHRITI